MERATRLGKITPLKRGALLLGPTLKQLLGLASIRDLTKKAGK